MTISNRGLARRCFAHAAGIAAVSLALSTLSAVAADFPPQPRPPIIEKPLWTGFYIGVHGGGGWASSRLVDPSFDLSFVSVDVKSNGWLAGAQVGANWQFGNMVVGGELDVSGASIKGSTLNLDGSSPLASGISADYRALATGTGRVGYAAGSYLGYIKAGVAWANIDVQSGVGLGGQPGVPVDVDHQRTGLTAGGGVELALISNLSARLEYDFIYFGSSSINMGAKLPVNLDHQIHLATLGLNWRFSE